MLKIRLQGTLRIFNGFVVFWKSIKNWMSWKYLMLMQIKEQVNIFVFM